VFRFDVSEPSLNPGKKVRLVAMWASQRRYVARQAGETLSVQIDIAIDQSSGRGAYKFQYGHYYPLVVVETSGPVDLSVACDDQIASCPSQFGAGAHRRRSATSPFKRLAGAAEWRHRGSSRQKLHDEVGQHQETDGEEHHGQICSTLMCSSFIWTS
jgi:hypothetical protein